MKRSIRLSIVALFAVVALLAAACGADEDTNARAPGGTDDPSALPVNSNSDPTPSDAAGTCLAGEPDCADDPGLGDQPQDLPPPSDTPSEPSPTGMLVDGGLSVSDALATDASGIIAVSGFLFIDEQGARLCDALAESFPPQCGGPSLPVTNYEEVLGSPLSSNQGISWTDDYVSFLGEIVDGTLVVDPTIAQ